MGHSEGGVCHTVSYITVRHIGAARCARVGTRAVVLVPAGHSCVEGGGGAGGGVVLGPVGTRYEAGETGHYAGSGGGRRAGVNSGVVATGVATASVAGGACDVASFVELGIGTASKDGKSWFLFSLRVVLLAVDW